MIQLMIVDDEPLFREFLINFISWEDYGFQIVAETKNGVEALEKADIHQPDVILTDINMPKMDGLDFAKKLLVRAPETAIVFITGHDEFDYAKEAIRIGAYDYILKPFEKEELILTLLKIKDNIHNAHQVDLSEADDDATFIMPLLTSKVHHNDAKLLGKLKKLGFYDGETSYGVACLDIDHLEHTYSNQEEKMLWRFSVMNILKELVETSNDFTENECHIFYDYEGNIICLFRNDGDSLSSNSKYIQILNQLLASVNKYLDFTITIGLSSVKQGLEGITTCYNEALSALHYKYLQNTSQIIHFSSLPDENTDFSWYNASFNEQILSCLRRKDIDKLNDLFEALYMNMINHHISINFSLVIQLGLISMLVNYIFQTGKSPDIIFGNDFSPFDEFNSADTLKLQQQHITMLYVKTIEYFSKNTASRTQQIAIQGKQYIDEHYSNSSLTVQDIASAQYINQTYLRSMFKKEIGMTISDYLTKKRMETAASLIKEKAHRLADISEMVGYNDSSYFSKCFKKYYGMIPSQYELNA